MDSFRSQFITERRQTGLFRLMAIVRSDVPERFGSWGRDSSSGTRNGSQESCCVGSIVVTGLECFVDIHCCYWIGMFCWFLFGRDLSNSSAPQDEHLPRLWRVTSSRWRQVGPRSVVVKSRVDEIRRYCSLPPDSTPSAVAPAVPLSCSLYCRWSCPGVAKNCSSTSSSHQTSQL